MILFFALLMIGSLIAFAGAVWSIVAAFQRHWGWGLAVLLIPFASFVFLFVAWQEARKPFFVSIAGAVVCGLGLLAAPRELSGGEAGGLAALLGSGHKGTAPSIAPSLEELEARLMLLKERERELLRRKTALDPKDTSSVKSLIAEINTYNIELKDVTRQLESEKAQKARITALK